MYDDTDYSPGVVLIGQFPLVLVLGATLGVAIPENSAVVWRDAANE